MAGQTPILIPSLADVVRAGIEARLMDVHTAIPCSVVKVDTATAKIDVKPLVKDVIEPRSGERQAISVPIITDVPVIWPGAGMHRITFPIELGDFVLVIFTERSIDAWLDQGHEVDPGDPRRHSLSDAVAIPGLRPFGKAWQGIDNSKCTIGLEGGPAHPAAWADKVLEAVNNLKAAVENHTHKYNPGPGPLAQTLSAVASSAPDVPVSVPDMVSKQVVIKG